MTVVLGRLDAIVALGVAALLRDDRRLRVLECGPADSALEDALQQLEPQVAILGETAEPTIVERLLSIRPQTTILVLAHDPMQEHGMRLLAAGANCVARNASDIDVCAMVHLTAQGKRFFAGANGEWIERSYPMGTERLTKRQREVLGHLVKDEPYAAIAWALHISYRTVQMHVPRILEKLGVEDRSELVGMPLPDECVAD
jgi:DNA-binding NarL/FixJ family response regulator